MNNFAPKTLEAFAGMAKALEKVYGAISYMTISTNKTSDSILSFDGYFKHLRKERYQRRYHRRGERMRKHGK